MIGFAWGFHVQDFAQTLLILGVGIVISSLIVLPPWPFWKRNPLKWQKVTPKVDPSTSAATTTAGKTNVTGKATTTNKKLDAKKK